MIFDYLRFLCHLFFFMSGSLSLPMPVTPFTVPLAAPAVALAPATVVLALVLTAFFAVLTQEQNVIKSNDDANSKVVFFMLSFVLYYIYTVLWCSRSSNKTIYVEICVFLSSASFLIVTLAHHLPAMPV